MGTMSQLSAHLTLDGDWVTCVDADCKLKFHIPGMSIPEIEALPELVLISLLEAVDPPTSVVNGHKMWYFHDRDGEIIFHREYDLPATIDNEGTMEWWYAGNRHRGGDQPAVIYSDGSTERWLDGKLLRKKNGNPL